MSLLRRELAWWRSQEPEVTSACWDLRRSVARKKILGQAHRSVAGKAVQKDIGTKSEKECGRGGSGRRSSDRRGELWDKLTQSWSGGVVTGNAVGGAGLGVLRLASLQTS